MRCLSVRLSSLVICLLAMSTCLGQEANSANGADLLAQQVNNVVSSRANKVDVTIYGSHYAQIEELRVVDLHAGANTIHLEGVARQYRQESFHLVSVSDAAKFQLRSVVYQPANLSREALLTQSIGKHVSVRAGNSPAFPANSDITGTLKAVNGGDLIIADANGNTQIVSNPVGVTCDGGVGNLSNSASLVLEVQATDTGKYTLKILYETEGLTYNVKHSLVLNSDATSLDFDTSVALYNSSGTDFQDATVRLISGTVVGNAYDEAPSGSRYEIMGASARTVGRNASVEAVGEQKLFTVPGIISLTDGQSRQISLISAQAVPTKQEYFIAVRGYGENKSQTPVSLRLKLENNEASHLNRDIPAGPVKVYQLSSSGNLQLTGSATMTSKAPGECFDLVFGTTPDIKWESRLVEQKESDATPPAVAGTPAATPLRTQYYHWAIEVHNYKDNNVEVIVEVPISANAKVKTLMPYGLKRESATLIKGNVSVPSKASAGVHYEFEVTN